MSILRCSYIFCVCFIFFLEQGTTQIPPGLKYGSSSGCHGTAMAETQVNATCPNGSVIAINDVTMGAKPIVLGCPLLWNSSWTYEECCTKKSEDCNFAIYENKQYHDQCNGKEQCILATQFQQIHEECNDYNETFGANGAYSNYMFMDYYCVQDDYIVDMCTTSSTSTESDTVYIWNDNFPTSPITTAVTSCQCSVEIDNCESDIEVYTIYRYLAGNSNDSSEQNVTVYDSENDAVLQWNYDAKSLWFSMDTVANTYITVELNNQMNTTDGRVWLGFRASSSSNITVNCPAKPQESCKTTTDSTTTTMMMTTNDSTTTTIDTATIEGDNKANNLLTILEIVLAVLCLILIIVIVILCICLIKRRGTTDMKDAESPPCTDIKRAEVHRTNFRNVKPNKVEVLPPNVALNGVHNDGIKVRTTDMGCQTNSPVQSMADAQCQADHPITPMNNVLCQTDILNFKCATKNKKTQVKLELIKHKTDDKVTMTEMNLIDMAVQTDKRVKHKRELIKVTNNNEHQDEVEPETDKPQQTVENLVETDASMPQDSPSEKRKKKKMHAEKHVVDEYLDRKIQEATFYPVNEQEKEPECTRVTTPVDRFLFPVGKNQTIRNVREDSDSEINYMYNGIIFGPNRKEQRYRKQRNHIAHAFYAPEREQMKLEKFYRNYKPKKRKMQKTSSEV